MGGKGTGVAFTENKKLEKSQNKYEGFTQC